MPARRVLTVGIVAALARTSASGAVLAYGLNPLVLVESAMNGHVDVLARCVLPLAVLAIDADRVPLATLSNESLCTGDLAYSASGKQSTTFNVTSS